MKKVLGGVIVLLSAVFGDVLVVTIPSDSLGGNIAAKIYFPDSARFSTGAPVIIHTPGMFILQVALSHPGTRGIVSVGSGAISAVGNIYVIRGIRRDNTALSRRVLLIR